MNLIKSQKSKNIEKAEENEAQKVSSYFGNCKLHPKSQIKWLVIKPNAKTQNVPLLCIECAQRGGLQLDNLLDLIPDLGPIKEDYIFSNWPVNEEWLVNNLITGSIDYISIISSHYDRMTQEILNLILDLKKQDLEAANNFLNSKCSFITQYNRICKKKELQELVAPSPVDYQERIRLANQLVQEINMNQTMIKEDLKNLSRQIHTERTFDQETPNQIEKDVITLLKRMSFFQLNQNHIELDTHNYPQQITKIEKGNQIHFNQNLNLNIEKDKLPKENQKINGNSFKIDQIIQLIKNPFNFLAAEYLESIEIELKKHAQIFEMMKFNAWEQNSPLPALPNLNTEDLQGLAKLIIDFNSNKQANHIHNSQKEPQQQKKLNHIETLVELIKNPFNQRSIQNYSQKLELELKKYPFVFEKLIELPILDENEQRIPLLNYLNEQDMNDLANIAVIFNQNRDREFHNKELVPFISQTKFIIDEKQFSLDETREPTKILMDSLKGYSNSFTLQLKNNTPQVLFIGCSSGDSDLSIDIKVEELISSRNLTVLKVCLCYSMITDFGMRRLADAMKNMFSNITEYNFEIRDNNLIGTQGYQSLIESIGSNSKLTSLKLLIKGTGNRIDGHCFFREIERLENLTEFTLSMYCIFEQVTVGFGENIAKLKNLTKCSLSFYGDSFGTKVIKSLATSLPNLKYLSDLYLSLNGNQIGNEGAMNFAENLHKFNQETNIVLDLLNNSISDEGANALGMSIAKLSPSQEIIVYLQQNNISESSKNEITRLFADKKQKIFLN